MKILIILFIAIQTGYASLSSNISCSVDDVEFCGRCKNIGCVAHGDNLINTFGGVSTVEECKILCKNEKGNQCKYLTYFNEAAFPLQEFCYLYSSCEKHSDCSECVTETADCMCSSSVIGQIDNTNLLRDIPDINSEKDCQRSCSLTSLCQFYTYLSDQLQCILLSELKEPVKDCEYCRTGPVDCSETKSTTTNVSTSKLTTSTTTATTETHTTSQRPDCSILLANGERHQYYQVESNEDELHLIIHGGPGCHMKVLAVGGGGGHGGYDSGSGSGYLQYVTSSIPWASRVNLTAGEWGNPSLITIDGVTTIAYMGQNCYQDSFGLSRGGNGFSGGGGTCAVERDHCEERYNGGSNGGDGYGSSSIGSFGHGTQEDLRLYPMRNFRLSPGVGGDEYVTKEGWHMGGGGGGVLVNGRGPQRISHYQGEGYGGGGGWNEGLPGVVLIEVDDHLDYSET